MIQSGDVAAAVTATVNGVNFVLVQNFANDEEVRQKYKQANK